MLINVSCPALDQDYAKPWSMAMPEEILILRPRTSIAGAAAPHRV